MADKARRVQAMFAAIAPSYDLNNRLHSLGRDQAWRRAAVRFAGVRSGDVVLDVACGTGDLALAFGRAGAARVVGVDFTVDMLRIAWKKGQGPRAEGQGAEEKGGGRRERSEGAAKSETGDQESEIAPPETRNSKPETPAYAAGDALRLPVADGSVDVASIAFGIRNVADPAAALREFHRVLRPGGRAIVLEFSLPANRVLRGLYQFYFQRVLPRTAGWIARDRSGAYRYLPRSVSTFLDRAAMLDQLRAAGFTGLTLRPLTLGIAVVYRGVRR